jgi:hypothetical protein
LGVGVGSVVGFFFWGFLFMTGSVVVVVVVVAVVCTAWFPG